ncbi:MAG TPA: histidine phosphatase family protein [Dehalococcoidia bacterium]|nr:histidine phosphatase family protein [Dehalococcoidia bacterium]
MNLFLVRHGETAHNRDGVGFGRTDVPLTELGERQADATGRRLAKSGIELAITSPLSRAKETARAIASCSGIELQEYEGLIELDVGETEGLPLTLVREKYPDFISSWIGADGFKPNFPGGESLLDVRERAAAILAEAEGMEVQNLAIVSHNFVLRMILCDLIGIPPSQFRRFSVDLASVSVLARDQGRTFVRTFNDCCHLANLDS